MTELQTAEAAEKVALTPSGGMRKIEIPIDHFLRARMEYGEDGEPSFMTVQLVPHSELQTGCLAT